MYKSCSRCGKVHSTTYKCNHNRFKKDTEARQLRQKNIWHRKSEEVRKKSKYLCSICKEEGIYNYKDLEVHHITPIEENKDRLLDNYNLICLCQEHHKQAEIGKIDRDYLYKLAKRREDD
jgi:5-methylcytosine-specific restriction endonuclease McrA